VNIKINANERKKRISKRADPDKICRFLLDIVTKFETTSSSTAEKRDVVKDFKAVSWSFDGFYEEHDIG